MNTTITRSRWAAVGAAVAVTLGAGGIGLVSATSPADAVAYVPITPCRVADTRPQADFNTGPRNTPITQNETQSPPTATTASASASPPPPPASNSTSPR